MSQAPPELIGVFRRPFREQVAFFRGKLARLLPTTTWRDVMRAEHDRAFLVAGAQQADLLADLAAAVDAAISSGESLDAFRARFRDIVARHGWTGWTGEGTAAGRAWRTRVIYRTNMATSYAAGRWAQLQDFPIWIYRHGGSREPRPQHLAWDRMALPREHPFWATHYPPNGWGCSCYVVGAGSPEAARIMGGNPDKRPPAGWDARDAKGRLPGVDEGWDYAPGATVAQAVRATAAKTVAWPYELGKAFMEAVPEAQRDALAMAIRRQPETGEALRRFAEAALGERGGQPIPRLEAGYQTLGPLTQAEAAAAAAATSVQAVAAQVWDWTVEASAVRHVMAEHGDPAGEERRGQRPVTMRDWARLPLWVAAQAMLRVDAGLMVMRVRDGEEEIVLVWRPLTRRRMLTLATLYVRRPARTKRP